jgi:hypothetical protein
MLHSTTSYFNVQGECDSLVVPWWLTYDSKYLIMYLIGFRNILEYDNVDSHISIARPVHIW